MQAEQSLHCLLTEFNGFFSLCWGLTRHQTLWVILCRLPEKGSKEKEAIVEQIKERNGEGTGMKVKKQKK